jgi:hypothetical protein
MGEGCPKCHGTSIVKEADGSIHVCWDCLQEGRLDVHSKDPKESGIQI